MPSLILTLQNKYNTDQSISAPDLMYKYLWGIPTCNPTTKREIPETTINQAIIVAQRMVESMLDIKFKKQVITEQEDFIYEEFSKWGYIKSDYVVNKIFKVDGFLNNVQQISYPVEWFSIRRQQSQDLNQNSRQIFLVPNSGNGSQVIITYGGTFLLTKFLAANWIPNFWHIVYTTGFDKIPDDLMDVVAKMCAINVLVILEPFAVGGTNLYGLTGSSLSIDGLSQSINKMNGGNIYQQRILQYYNEIKMNMYVLEQKYKGYRLTTM